MTARTVLSLAGGLFVHAVLRFDLQVHAGRKVAWEVGPLLGGPRATIALNDENALFFSVIAASGVEASTPPVVNGVLNEFLILWCCLEHVGPERARLYLAINGEIVSEITINSLTAEDWGVSETELMSSLGADVLGADPAAITLMQLAVVGGKPTRNQLNAILDASLVEYRLGPFELKGHYGGD